MNWRPWRATALAALLGLLLAGAPNARARTGDFVIHAGKVVTVEGAVLAEGGSIYVSGGRIAEVKAGHVNPWGAEVRSFEDHWCLPGFVEAHSQGGLERGNETAPNTPFVSVLDGIDPLGTYFEDLLRDGVTTVLVIPGDATLIGGQGMVLDPVGRTVEEMIVSRNGGMKVALAPRRKTSRMAQMAELRAAFDATRRAEGDRTLRDPDAAEDDPRARAMARMLLGELPAVLACEEPVDVSNAVRLLDDYGLRGFLVIGPRCRRALPLIAERKLPVVLPADLEPLERDQETGREVRRELAREFHDAGVPLVLQANERSAYGSRSLWYQAARAVAQGVSREEALRAVTLNPAEILGVAERVGSITAGKDANLVLWSGDPLDPASWVEHVFVEGELVYERSKDRKLRRLTEGSGAPEEDR